MLERKSATSAIKNRRNRRKIVIIELFDHL